MAQVSPRPACLLKPSPTRARAPPAHRLPFCLACSPSPPCSAHVHKGATGPRPSRHPCPGPSRGRPSSRAPPRPRSGTLPGRAAAAAPRRDIRARLPLFPSACVPLSTAACPAADTDAKDGRAAPGTLASHRYKNRAATACSAPSHGAATPPRLHFLSCLQRCRATPKPRRRPQTRRPRAPTTTLPPRTRRRRSRASTPSSSRSSAPSSRPRPHPATPLSRPRLVLGTTPRNPSLSSHGVVLAPEPSAATPTPSFDRDLA